VQVGGDCERVLVVRESRSWRCEIFVWLSGTRLTKRAVQTWNAQAQAQAAGKTERGGRVRKREREREMERESGQYGIVTLVYQLPGILSLGRYYWEARNSWL